MKWTIKPSSGLLFPAVDFMRQRIIAELSSSDRANKPNQIVVDCTHFDKTDFTAAQVRCFPSFFFFTACRRVRLLSCNYCDFPLQGIKSLINELDAVSCRFELINARKSVAEILEATLHIKISTVTSVLPAHDSVKKIRSST